MKFPYLKRQSNYPLASYVGGAVEPARWLGQPKVSLGVAFLVTVPETEGNIDDEESYTEEMEGFIAAVAENGNREKGEGHEDS